MIATGSYKGRVLIVDDEPAVRESYCHALIKAGFWTAEASGAPDALRHLKEHHFDLVLTDISLPEADGLSLLRRLRALSTDIPVVLMLEKQDNNIANRALALGALQYLVKPISPETLEETATHALTLHRSQLGTLATFRNRRGQVIRHTCFTASNAKKEFGHVLEKVIELGAVVITKHDTPKAVLLSVEEFNSLAHSAERKLDSLSDEFDSLLARMQMPNARRDMKTAFGASPKELGRAAMAAALKRG